jgi:hypothetical protein
MRRLLIHFAVGLGVLCGACAPMAAWAHDDEYGHHHCGWHDHHRYCNHMMDDGYYYHHHMMDDGRYYHHHMMDGGYSHHHMMEERY